MTATGRPPGAARTAALVLAAAAAGLSGCGQTGPLYLPEDASATVITRPGPAATAPATTAPADSPTDRPGTATDKTPARR